jgi:hypothetical protein
MGLPSDEESLGLPRQSGRKRKTPPRFKDQEVSKRTKTGVKKKGTHLSKKKATSLSSENGGETIEISGTDSESEGDGKDSGSDIEGVSSVDKEESAEAELR